MNGNFVAGIAVGLSLAATVSGCRIFLNERECFLANDKSALKFNRVKRKGINHYIKEYSSGGTRGDEIYQGYVKCKLVHLSKYSLIVPDQLYLKVGKDLEWIQPLYMASSVVMQLDDGKAGRLTVDVSHGLRLLVDFKGGDLVNSYPDGSCLYSCQIQGPKFLYRYSTGQAQLVGEKLFIKLYHHTNKAARKGIESSKELWSSRWNIQGTEQFENVSFLYLTSLPAINNQGDLLEIAMSMDEKLHLRVDQNPTNNPDLTLTVYRGATKDRKEKLGFWVDTSLLAPQPLYRHRGYHEVVCPFIHRIAVEPSSSVAIVGNKLVPNEPKQPDYIVVGDANTVEGLEAPYKEKSDEIFHVEKGSRSSLELLEYWFDNSNVDLHTGRTREIFSLNNEWINE